MSRNLKNRELLRGIRVEQALACCGSCWDSSTPTGGEYETSEVVDELDDFLSHDWATGRWSKYLTLCLHYNGVAASWMSALSVLICGILVHLWELNEEELQGPCTHEWVAGGDSVTFHVGYAPWFTAFGGIVFIVVFTLWQHIRRLLGRKPRFVFVDKYCIHQTDEVLKMEGVLSLAGFLQKTNRLVILWSARYFTRLWCAYEVAGWVYLDRDVRETVDLLPVEVAAGVFFMTISTCVVVAIGDFWCQGNYTESDGIVSRVSFALVYAASAFWIVRLYHWMEILPEQLDNFSIEDSQCACCTMGHVHPDKPGKKIPCDRDLVVATLMHWEGEMPQHDMSQDMITSFVSKAGDAKQTALKEFNEFMQTTVRSAFISNPLRVRYRYAITIHLCMLFYFCAFAATLRGHWLPKLRILTLLASEILFVAPVYLKINIELLFWLAQRPIGNIVVKQILGVVCVTLVLQLVAIPHIWLVNYMLDWENPTLQIVVMLIEGFTCMKLYTFDNPNDVGVSREEENFTEPVADQTMSANMSTVRSLRSAHTRRLATQPLS